jgi:hypothetical protein
MIWSAKMAGKSWLFVLDHVSWQFVVGTAKAVALLVAASPGRANAGAAMIIHVLAVQSLFNKLEIINLILTNLISNKASYY